MDVVSLYYMHDYWRHTVGQLIATYFPSTVIQMGGLWISSVLFRAISKDIKLHELHLPQKPASSPKAWRNVTSQRLLSHCLAHVLPTISAPDHFSIAIRAARLSMDKCMFPATYGVDSNKYYLPFRSQDPIGSEDLPIYIGLHRCRREIHSEILRAFLSGSLSGDFLWEIILGDLNMAIPYTTTVPDCDN